MNVFDCAIKIEEEAQQYYKRLETQSTSPDKRHLFAMLAASEEEHKNNLMQLKKKMGNDVAQMDSLEYSACRFRPILTERELMEEELRDPDFYKFAVWEEEQEIQFFEDLARKTKNERVRRALHMLADEERRHLNMVENIYEFMETPRTYLAWGEFSNLRDL